MIGEVLAVRRPWSIGFSLFLFCCVLAVTGHVGVAGFAGVLPFTVA